MRDACLSHAQRPRVVVAADDARAGRRRQAAQPGFTARPRLGHQSLPEARIVATPAQEGEAVGVPGAQQPGGDVGRHQGRLDGQRGRPAERVVEAAPGGGLLRPGGKQQHGRGEILLERRLYLHLVGAVPAPVQAVAAQVDRYRYTPPREVRVHAQIRRVRLHRGSPPAVVSAELVDDRVLHAYGAVPRVADGIVHPREVDRQGAVGPQVGVPGHMLNGGIQLVVTARRPREQRQQHTRAQARPETDAVGGLQ